MRSLLGCVLVMAGSIGFAWSICRDGAKRLKLLKQIGSIYEELKYYIAYQKATIPEALWHLAKKEQGLFAGAFETIYERVCGQGEDFSFVWGQCMAEVLRQQPLTKDEKKLLFQFPSCLGFMEEKVQAQALDGMLREINLHIGEIEKGQKDKNRVVMSLGVAAGALISILLL